MLWEVFWNQLKTVLFGNQCCERQCCARPRCTPRPRAALLMCLKKYSAIGNSAIGNYVVLYSKLTLKTVLLEVNFGKND